MSTFIYKILRPAEWAAADGAERFSGAPIDLEDGYIHFSTAAQVAETARRYFADEETIHLLAIDPYELPVGILKWEPSRGGDLFPHLYAELPMRAVVKHWTLPKLATGGHDLSPIFEEEAP